MESRSQENEVKGLELLHSVDYNYTKAKFYLFYPVLRLLGKDLSEGDMQNMLAK